MKDVRDAISKILDGTTVAQALERSDSVVHAQLDIRMYQI